MTYFGLKNYIFLSTLIIPLTSEGTMTPEANEAIDPERLDSARSMSCCSLWCKGKGDPLKRLCFCWLRLTKEVQDWKPDSWPGVRLCPAVEATEALVWPPSEDERAKWLGVKCPGSRWKLLRLAAPTDEASSRKKRGHIALVLAFSSLHFLLEAEGKLHLSTIAKWRPEVRKNTL